MHGTDARTGQHRHRGFGNHRHVQRDHIAPLDAQLLEAIGKLADTRVQLAIGDRLGLVRVIPFPDDGDLIATLGEVAIEAVVRHVELAVLEPAHIDITGAEVGIADHRGRIEPVQ